jgi:uncharacterized protein
MSLFREDYSLPSKFDGWVRLFPLPNYVLFPGILKGLHVFERRYCAMLSAALAGDQLIAMSVLQPGWEADYLNSPKIYDSICIGRISHHEPATDGRHNILLRGLRRAKVREEKPSADQYRMAKVELIDDVADTSESDSNYALQLLWQMVQTHSSLLPVTSSIHFPKRENCTLPRLVDFLSHELPFEIEKKVMLLGESNVGKRYATLMNYFAGFSGFVRGDKKKGEEPPENLNSLPNCSLN